MLVFRICHKKWSKSLKASGVAARWNSTGKYVIYTASSRALACLENIVHRSGLGSNELFRTVVIEVPTDISIIEVDIKTLPKDWIKSNTSSFCRKYGDRWIAQSKSCILKVPSAIIPFEYNYLLNTLHPEFPKIIIHHFENFRFDVRL